ncbi:DUF4040 family protein [Enemella sp. A6]|uniref:DUF4040 family protein n=1 Tax=Enemella sp. A6 TaxID=3440152 RepID=UPI003EBAB292
MLLITLAITAVVCVVTLILGRTLGRRAGWIAALGLLGAAGTLWYGWTGRSADGVVAQGVDWIPSLGVALSLRLDGISLVFGLIVLVIGAVVLAYTAGYLPRGRHGAFLGLLTFFAAAMTGLVLADDIIVLWVMWEFTTVCSFLLISQSGPKGKGPAIRTFLVTAAGGLALLSAVALIWARFGTTRLSTILAAPDWQQAPGFATAIAVLIAFAAFTKAAQFPFHAWLPDAMVASTPVSAYLHAAAMVKAGIYLLLRFSTALGAVPAWNIALIVIGLITALLGAVLALQRRDLKELLAYSTVSQLGFLVATIGIGSTYALLGAIVHVIAHALFKSALFMAVGVIDHQWGTRRIGELSGVHRTMPWTAGLLTLGAVSMAGLPPLFGFVSKEAMFKAMAAMPAPLAWPVGAVAVLAAVFTFAYSARMVLAVFDGPRLDDAPREGGADLLVPVGVVAVTGLALGVAGPVAEPLINAAVGAVGASAEADLSLWHGFAPELYMTLAVVGLGAVLVGRRRQVDRLLDRELFPIRAIDVVEGFRTGSIAVGHRLGRLTDSDTPLRHLVPPLAVVVGLGGVGAVALLTMPGLPPVRPGVVRWVDFLILPLVAVGAALAWRARTRIALVTTVGVSGFAVALWFYALGAPDVALTQLLVEILTVVIMVLLLSRLPRTFHITGRRRNVFAGITGVLVGLIAMLATMALTGRREISEVGRDLLVQSYELTGGTNLVNVILVDFRALDTFGEAVVLGVTAVALVAALNARGLLPLRPNPIRVEPDSAIRDPYDNALPLRTTTRFLVPVLLGLSAFYYLRGHSAPGGGFIAALIGSTALALMYLSASSNRVRELRLPYLGFIAAGTVIAVAVGLLGLIDGSFLRPMTTELGPIKLSTALLFDLGVYLNVIGVILAAISKLGIDDHAPPLRHGTPRARGFGAHPGNEVGRE